MEAIFTRKNRDIFSLISAANNIKNLDGHITGMPYSIIETVELNKTDFMKFCNCFSVLSPVFKKYSEESKAINDKWQCILIKEIEKRWGIIVFLDQTSYPKYTALLV